MSFLRSVGLFFSSPIGGLAGAAGVRALTGSRNRSSVNPNNNLSTGMRGILQRLEAQRTNERMMSNFRRDAFLPSVSPSAPQNFGSDEYLFAGMAEGGLIDDTMRNITSDMFREEFGQNILQPGQAGFEAQRPKVQQFLKDRNAELSAARNQAQRGVSGQQQARLGNQTGGVRGGVARNPFNMNMMRGPQINAAPRNATQPAATPAARGTSGGPSNVMGQQNYLLR